MANKFEKKEWIDRQSQYPSRRKLIPTNTENVFDVERSEGDVTEPGNAFDAQNMNNLEDRVYNAFESLDGSDISINDPEQHFTKNDLDGVLYELFTFAADGKKAIADAVGGSPSMTFEELANLANNETIKKTIAEAIGETKSGTPTGEESIEELAGLIKNDKLSFYFFDVDSKLSADLYSYEGESAKDTVDIPCSLPFVPSFVVIENIESQGYGDGIYDVSYITLTNKKKESYDGIRVSEFFDIDISSISKNNITLTFTARSKLSQRYNHIGFLVGYSSTRIYTFK